MLSTLQNNIEVTSQFTCLEKLTSSNCRGYNQFQLLSRWIFSDKQEFTGIQQEFYRNCTEFLNSGRNIRLYFLPKFRITEIQNYRNSFYGNLPEFWTNSCLFEKSHRVIVIVMVLHWVLFQVAGAQSPETRSRLKQLLWSTKTLIRALGSPSRMGWWGTSLVYIKQFYYEIENMNSWLCWWLTYFFKCICWRIKRRFLNQAHILTMRKL